MKFIGKLLKTVVLTALALFVSTFIIYMFNLENKLIYKVIYPFLRSTTTASGVTAASEKRQKRYPPRGGYLFA